VLFIWTVIQDHFPVPLQKIYILQPTGFLQKFADTSLKFLREEIQWKVIIFHIKLSVVIRYVPTHGSNEGWYDMIRWDMNSSISWITWYDRILRYDVISTSFIIYVSIWMTWYDVIWYDINKCYHSRTLSWITWYDTILWYYVIWTNVFINILSHGSHDTIRYYDTMWYEQMSSLTYFLMDHTIRYDTILRPSDNRVVQYYKCHHCCTLYNISMQLNLTICWNCHSHTLLYYVCLICTMIYTMIFCVICTMILIFTMICKLKRYYCTMIFYHDMYHDVDM